jgi:hypothetical protein
MLQNNLFQMKESLFVIASLTNLNTRTPILLRLNSMTFLANLSTNNVFNNETLLQDRISENFLLNGQLDFNTLRMRLSPYKRRICEAKSGQLSLYTTQTHSKQFFRLKFSCLPRIRRNEIAIAELAVLKIR